MPRSFASTISTSCKDSVSSILSVLLVLVLEVEVPSMLFIESNCVCPSLNKSCFVAGSLKAGLYALASS